jgi:hypothetical protein
MDAAPMVARCLARQQVDTIPAPPESWMTRLEEYHGAAPSLSEWCDRCRVDHGAGTVYEYGQPPTCTTAPSTPNSAPGL